MRRWADPGSDGAGSCHRGKPCSLEGQRGPHLCRSAFSLGATERPGLALSRLPSLSLFPSGVSLVSARSRTRLDLWGQVVGAGEHPPRPGQHPRLPPCPPQVLPARAGPRAAAVGADAPRGAPAGPGALACCVLRDGPGIDQVGWVATRGAGPGPAGVLTAPWAPPAAACSPSSSAAITAPTSPSTTASSRSSPRARKPRKHRPWPPPPPLPCPDPPAPSPPAPAPPALPPSLPFSLSL